ncbi:MAG: chemotaxis protein CheA [Desulfuromonadales bacterium]
MSSSQGLKDFISETEEIIGSLNLDLVKLADALDAGACDPDLLNGIFRGAHSLKGLAGMFGFDDLAALSNAMENLLDGLRLGRIPLTDPLIDTLFSALDVLSGLIDGKNVDEHFTLDLGPVLLRIKQAAECAPRDAADLLTGLGIDSGILSVLTEYEEHRLRENLRRGRCLHLLGMDFDLASFDQELAEITQQLKQQGEVISTLPSVGAGSERIAFQILYGSDLNQAGIGLLLSREMLEIHSYGNTAAAAGQDNAACAEPAALQIIAADQLLPLEADDAEGGSSAMRSISRTVRVDLDKLDLLMNVVGELVLSKSAIASISDCLKGTAETELAGDLGKATRILERRLQELQKGVMAVRMVPVGQLFDKMTRIVRRVSHEQGKQVELDIRGADTELDKLIIEDVSAPLMHIIRNALDHGIESPRERRLAGKAEKGLVQLRAAQKGNHVVIEVHDDGRGIDTARVRRKALENGLITPAQPLSEREAFDLLFMPGFSTRDEVSDLSGRGVGLDVVRNNIAALSGIIEVKSRPGQGSSMIITLPITLAIIKVLTVRIGEEIYALPTNSVVETLMIDADAIQTIEKREVIEVRDSTLPLLRLDQLFALAMPDKRRDHRHFIAVVALAEKRMGFVVDEFIGQQDVVIKPLGRALGFVRGVAGAAELGDQKTILVLDVAALMSEALHGESAGEL